MMPVSAVNCVAKDANPPLGFSTLVFRKDDVGSKGSSRVTLDAKEFTELCDSAMNMFLREFHHEPNRKYLRHAFE